MIESPSALPDPLPIPRLQGSFSGTIELPGSKSITNRALLCAALASGTSILERALDAADTRAMISCIEGLGATVAPRGAHQLEVTGTAGKLPLSEVALDANQSGTTARFVLPTLMLGTGRYELTGDAQLRGRPFGDLIEAMRSMGADVRAPSQDQLPLIVHGGSQLADRVTLGAATSSQFASGLLLSAPCLPDGLEVIIEGHIVSQPYLDMTVAVMRSFGASVSRSGNTYLVQSGGYSAAEYEIEPDASTASYFFGLAAASNGSVTVPGLTRSSLQGDAQFVDVLACMGAIVVETHDGLSVAGTGSLTAVDANLADLSDTAPTLAAVAACAEGTTTVDGIGFIRNKESDRVAGVVAELTRLGIIATETDDGFNVTGSPISPAAVRTYDDHRMAMAFTVLGLAKGGVSIQNPRCVEKTFPGFYSAIFAIASQNEMETEEEEEGKETELRVIAIDGPSGSGKSTVARALAKRLGVDYLDTGAMYRAVAFAALRYDTDPADEEAINRLVHNIEIEVTEDGVTVDEVDGTVEIRGPEVTRAVSAIAANPVVRDVMRVMQREWGTKRGKGVVEGRDIGTVVFPDAALKVFLTADTSVRAGRRAKEVTDLDYETVAADLVRRDTADTTREHNPLAVADDAVILETTDMSIDDVVQAVVDLLEKLDERG